MSACVAEQQKHPPSKSGGLHCPSWVRVLPHAPTHCRLPIADFRFGPIVPSDQSAIGNLEIGNVRKGSLTGKAVVLKTTAHCRLQVQVLSLPPIAGEASPNGMAAVC